MKLTEITSEKNSEKIMRLAAYCRVSTDSDDQLHSFAAQVRYYESYADSRDEFELVDIYADEGLSGTDMKKRDEMNRMIRDCEKGKSRPEAPDPEELSDCRRISGLYPDCQPDSRTGESQKRSGGSKRRKDSAKKAG